ncbi:HVA22-like protein i [Bidens hawaiensis]|uniref:HVA22-like protein i n=1 Tax=Bidens hawaiensis TaxID=980011 RepID=UPI00404AC88A
MLGYMLNRLLILLLAYAYPAYECFKSIEKNKPDVEQLRFWCQYWIIIAVMTVWDPFGDAIIGWLPMYSETKLVICVYLWYPKTQGTKYIYESFLKPFISKHEPEIDRTLSEFKTRAGDSASLYFQRVLSYAQTRSFDLLQLVMAQSIQRPPTQGPQAQTDSKASAASATSTATDANGARLRK